MDIFYCLWCLIPPFFALLGVHIFQLMSTQKSDNCFTIYVCMGLRMKVEDAIVANQVLAQDGYV